MSSNEAIWFFTEGINYVLRGKRELRPWIRKIIAGEGQRLTELNIILCSDDYLLEINNNYLKHNTLTDIITFDLSEEKGHIQGDIYISVERARENAKEFRVTLSEELKRLIVHGVLHLAGYKDKAKKDKLLMTQKEDYYLSLPAK